jgi:hypothetical protein
MNETLASDWADTESVPSPEPPSDHRNVEAFYDPQSKGYWTQNAEGRWMEVNETGLKRYLKNEGFASILFEGEHLCEVEAEILRIQQHCSVSLAGPLAGYRIGPTEICGNRVLVTSEAKLIRPQPGPHPLLDTLMENLFCDPVCDQRIYMKGWLKFALEALQTRSFRPGQAVAMAGERDCGKSFWQKIITELLGGRTAKPYRYMAGDTPFNGELFGAEHLMIEDDVASTQLQKRRTFGSHIKAFTVNETQSWHAKGLQAMTLTPTQRLSITLNNEPENLMILPPLDESLGDKLMLLKVHKHPMPMPTNTTEERKAFWAALKAEFPAFVWHLNQLQIPADLASPRFGIKHYHHPDLLAAIDANRVEIVSISHGPVFFGAMTYIGNGPVFKRSAHRMPRPARSLRDRGESASPRPTQTLQV